MRILLVLLVLLVLLLLVMPVVGQETTPGETPVSVQVVAETDLNLIYTALILIVGLSFGLLALFGGALLALYKSQPQWGQSVSRELFETLISSLLKLAEMTPSPIDDDLLNELANDFDTEIFDKQTKQVAQHKTAVDPP